MKRILLACFLLTATCTLSSIQQASAQIASSVTRANFNTKVNQMDTQIGAGNLTGAQTTWTAIHEWMKTILNDTKHTVQSAPSTSASSTAMGYLNTQESLYREIWTLKNDMATNRVALKTKLLAFSNTIN